MPQEGITYATGETSPSSSVKWQLGAVGGLQATPSLPTCFWPVLLVLKQHIWCVSPSFCGSQPCNSLFLLCVAVPPLSLHLCDEGCLPAPLQVLVYHDLLGMMSHPHHAKVTPKFCKRYAEVGHVIQDALVQYRQEVTDGLFPGQQYSPYSIQQAEVDALVKQLQESGMEDCAAAVSAAAAAADAGKRQ